MTVAVPDQVRLELAPQRAMFALEFFDPIGDGLVAEGLHVSAEGLRPPTVTPSNRFVWLERGAPADRRIAVRAVSLDRMFAPFEEMLDIPANDGDAPVASLIFRRELQPTSLYVPPPGRTAVSGMLIEGEGLRAPVTGALIHIRFKYAEGMETFTSRHAAVSDATGGFVAVADPLGDVRPDPIRRAPGTFGAWLTLERGDDVRVCPLTPLRAGRLNRIPAPVQWTALQPPDLE